MTYKRQDKKRFGLFSESKRGVVNIRLPYCPAGKYSAARKGGRSKMIAAIKIVAAHTGCSGSGYSCRARSGTDSDSYCGICLYNHNYFFLAGSFGSRIGKRERQQAVRAISFAYNVPPQNRYTAFYANRTSLRPIDLNSRIF